MIIFALQVNIENVEIEIYKQKTNASGIGDNGY